MTKIKGVFLFLFCCCIYIFTLSQKYWGLGVGGGKLCILFSGENKPVQLYFRLTDMCTLNTLLYSKQNTCMSAAVSEPFIR